MEHKQMNIVVLGNDLEDLDALPTQMLPDLKILFPNSNIFLFDPTEEIPVEILDNFVIIDTVLGIDDVMVFRSFEEFALSPRITVHDFDLPLFLGMMKKLGKLKTVTIIGIPPTLTKKEALQKTSIIISSM